MAWLIRAACRCLVGGSSHVPGHCHALLQCSTGLMSGLGAVKEQSLQNDQLPLGAILDSIVQLEW